uniref:Uncharacterized protein n=1 Tax=Megaselia scalaris TaxID=36166 RepID=T1GWF9_MEGSC
MLTKVKFVTDKTKQHFECCNDQFYTDPVIDAVSAVYIKCKEKFGEDKSTCFHTCVFKDIGFYSDNGLDTDIMRKMLGSANMAGEDGDWKKTNINKWMDICFKGIPGGIECSQEIVDIDNCFWHHMFTNCPSYNPDKC